MPRILCLVRPVAMPVWKRAIDLAGFLVALPVFGLCTAGVSLLLLFTSPGPIFFRQKRVGYRGRVFGMYKFRTMHVAAETGSHEAHVTALLHSNQPMQKLDGGRDPRLIPGAWLLRGLGVDELPQVLNVLRGEMSLVGPRPCLQYEYKHYTPEQRRRTDAVPGLTGLWQVSGKNRTTFDTMIALDRRYAAEISLWQDLRILFLTVPAIISHLLDTARQRYRRTPPAPASPALPILRSTAGNLPSSRS